ncbi:MAG: electron transfer flavoprotein subunit beta/FixA family protein [Deltaproteobacteria bacterium]|nr:electron transfer flavoprotein subunit beta/FixA family protein [Deltaproteobacteria bacterium]
MKILVPVKRVADPDNANKVKVSGDGTKVTSDGLEWKMNPFDEWSLEAALRLTENGSSKDRVGEVVLVSIGPKDAVQTIRQGLAMGAERGILVESDDDSLDSHVVAQVIAAIAAEEKPDVIFFGKQSADGDSNVAGTKLAEMLDWPLVNYAMAISTDDEGKSFTVKRELDVGQQTLKVQSPCVFTSSDRILQPESVKNGVTPADFAYPESEGGRYASLKGIMKAKKKPVDEKSLADLGVEAKRVNEYVKFDLPPARSGSTTFVESVEELVQKLHSDAKVL